MKYLIIILCAIAATCRGRHVVINNQTGIIAGVTFFRSGSPVGSYTMPPGGTHEAEIPDDADTLYGGCFVHSSTPPNYATTVLLASTNPISISSGNTVVRYVISFPSTGAAVPQITQTYDGHVYTGMQPTPSLDYDGWQAAMAAGLAVWIIPIFGVTIMRIAKRGARTGGSVL